MIRPGQKKKASEINRLYAVILAGGSGTRFWPLSREATPKQMLKVAGDRTLIQQTVLRMKGLVPDRRVLVLTGERHAYDISRQLREVCGAEVSIITEPQGKNTAPAIGLAAIAIHKKSPSALMAVMPSDHVILENSRFAEVIKDASALAEAGYLVTIGVIPSRPETGYGYIEKGAAIKGMGKTAGFRAKRFVEKPELRKAREYCASDRFLWNSGMFVWKAERILQEISRQMPELYAGLMEIRKALRRKNEKQVVASVFKDLPSVSIDYGVMEHAPKVAVVPAEIGWSDVGSWSALSEISDADAAGNVISGNVIEIDSKDSIIYGDKRLIAGIGLRNMIVVDTPDATLVCSRKRAQDVRKVVEQLREKGADELREHVTTARPWGSYTVLEAGARYKIKRIVVDPGAKLSLQLHRRRSEHWIVVAGVAKVTIGKKTFRIHPDESTYVPVGCRHRLENPGRQPLEMIEVQSGDYVGEDDIVRFDDAYSR